MFSWFKKRPPAASELPKLTDWEATCRDCGTRSSRLHDLFCLRERCPFYGGQLATCECIYQVLALDADERSAVEEYIDDSVEPLAGIMERWKAALDAKGRLPFEAVALAASPDGLILAAARGELPFVRALLAEGIALDATNDMGYTALMAAAGSYRLETLRFLLGAGADGQRRDSHGHTPLHCAAGSPARESSSAGQARAECVRLLLAYGAMVDARDEGGGTPLMSAAWFGCEPSVEVLLKAGANPRLRDGRGRTAFDLARQRGHGPLAERLAALATSDDAVNDR